MAYPFPRKRARQSAERPAGACQHASRLSSPGLAQAMSVCEATSTRGRTFIQCVAELVSTQSPVMDVGQPSATLPMHAGDGIGFEISEAVKKVFAAAEAPINWDHQYIGTEPDERTNSMVTRENLDSVLARTLTAALRAAVLACSVLPR